MPCASCRGDSPVLERWNGEPSDRANLSATIPDARCKHRFCPAADVETTGAAEPGMQRKRWDSPEEANRQDGPFPARRRSREVGFRPACGYVRSRSRASVSNDKKRSRADEKKQKLDWWQTTAVSARDMANWIRRARTLEIRSDDSDICNPELRPHPRGKELVWPDARTQGLGQNSPRRQNSANYILEPNWPIGQYKYVLLRPIPLPQRTRYKNAKAT